MPATWPGTLPQYLQIDSNKEQVPDNRLISQTDTGPGKMRSRSSALPRPVSGVMLMDSTQLATLDSFIASDLAQGTLPFNFPAVRGGGTWLVRIAPSGGMPSYQNLGGDTWQVAIGIEVLP